MIDSHCHLEMFENDIPEVIKRACDAGVNTIITIGSDPESIAKAINLAEEYPMVYATVGIHPHEAKEFNEDIFKKIFELTRHPKVVGVGEIGLDYHYEHSPKDIQREVFMKQLNLAREIDLPVVIHCREAFNDTLKILKDSGVKKGVFHCFSGDLSQAKKVIENDFYISISGVVTFKNAKKPKVVARYVPDNYLLIETDAPYLAPEPMRGRRNEPAFLVYIAKVLSDLRGVTLEDIDRITTLNAKRLFKIGNLPRGEIAYKIRDILYLNITNRCTNTCKFCVKFHTDYVKGHNLRLEKEPTVDEVIKAIKDPKEYREIVFCGYGEPFLRLDLIKVVASWIRKHGGKVRINTNGHGNIIHGRKVLPELKGLIDSISISLNAHNKEVYDRICNPKYPNAYEEVLEFIKDAKKYIPNVRVTVVELPEVDLKKCEEIAKELSVQFKVRHLNQVG